MFSVLLRSEIFHFTPLHAARTLSLDRLEHYWLTSETALGFLADYYACAERPYRLPGVAGQVAKSKSTVPPKVPSRYGIGKDILYVLTGVAVDTMEAEPLKRKFTVVARVYYVGLIICYLN